jgi:hypothetical protein
MAGRWQRPPARDAHGRLDPELRARAKRRVVRALLGLVLVAIAAGLLAYACAPDARQDRERTLPACCSTPGAARR